MIIGFDSAVLLEFICHDAELARGPMHNSDCGGLASTSVGLHDVCIYADSDILKIF